MKFLEELSMNAFPALQTVLFDGWVLRFADGYSNRANSVNPIYSSSKEIVEKMEQCERIFKERKLKPTYKITPFIQPQNLDELLESNGYLCIHPTSVQILSLNQLDRPEVCSIAWSYDIDEQWFEAYCSFNGVSLENRIIHWKMLQNIIPMKFFTSLFVGNEIVACGMAVIENCFVGLFDITVADAHRRKGYGQQLLLNMLETAKALGAENAYLQVMLHNTPALRLYRRLGFKEEYQYHYRVLAD